MRGYFSSKLALLHNPDFQYERGEGMQKYLETGERVRSLKLSAIQRLLSGTINDLEIERSHQIKIS